MSNRIIIILFLLSELAFSQSRISIATYEKQLPFGLSVSHPTNFPKIGLAMSGGGSRSISQIGILQAFEEQNIKLDYITATSMGSVIGGMYSVGYNLNEIESIITTTNWEEFTSIKETNRQDLFVDEKITEDRALFSIRFDGFNPVIPTSINTGQKVLNYLNTIFINAPLSNFTSFDNLLYDFEAVATDLVNGRLVILNNGSMARSLRASSSVSFLLPPVQIDSLLLADGGLVANIPVQVAKNSGADIVIALNTTSKLRTAEELNTPWTVADQVVGIPINILSEQQLSMADVIVEPYLGEKKNNDFSSLEEIIQLGYDSFTPHVERIEQIQKQYFLNKYSENQKYYYRPKSNLNDEIAQKILESIGEKDSISTKEIEYYLTKEYLKGDYQKLDAVVNELQNETIISVETKFNPLINDCEIIGTTFLTNEQLKKFKDKVCKKPFNAKKILKQSLSFLSIYKKAGYVLTTIDKIVFDEKNGVLKVFIEEGVVNELRIIGNEKTNETVIRRELPFKVGKVLMSNDLSVGLENLRITDLFDEVDIRIQKEDNRNIVELNLKEKLSAVLRFGLKIDNEYFTQFLIDLRDENLYGTGSEIGLSFFAGPRNRNITIEQKASRIFDTYLTYSLKAFYNSTDINTYSDVQLENERRFEREKDGEYKQRRFGGSVGLGAQFRKFGTLYGEFAYQRNQIANMFNDPVDEYLQNIASLKFGFKIDSRDKIPFPQQGFLVESYYETAQKFLDAEVAFSKFYIDYNHYFTFNSLHTFHLKGMLGFGDETLPLSQQFAFGGQNRFAGYKEYDFRGRQIFTSSLGYRLKMPIKIFFDTYLGARYDLGSIWTEQEKIKFRNLRHGISATLSFDTPIGPADFSVARSFLLKNDPPNSIVSYGETVFYFNIGFTY
jgi:NTE family protein